MAPEETANVPLLTMRNLRGIQIIIVPNQLVFLSLDGNKKNFRDLAEFKDDAI